MLKAISVCDSFYHIGDENCCVSTKAGNAGANRKTVTYSTALTGSDT